MKNLTTLAVLVLLAVVVALLWRLDRQLEPLAELARVQLADRVEARREAAARAAAAQQEQELARAQAERAAAQQAAAVAETERRAREEAARRARLTEPVKPGEVVPEIVLDNHETVRGAVVVAVQSSSVSFKVGARLYNVPTEQLPAELRARVNGMFPVAPAVALPAAGAQP